MERKIISYEELKGILDKTDDKGVLFLVFKPFLYDAILLYNGESGYRMGDDFMPRLSLKENDIKSGVISFEAFVNTELELNQYADKREGLNRFYDKKEIFDELEKAHLSEAQFEIFDYLQ